MPQPFGTFDVACLTLFYVSVGDFRGVVDTAFDEDLVLVGVLVIVFVIVSFIIALNLLIALFTTTFSTILETSKAQYEQLRIKVLNEYSYSYICTELPIPLNFLPGLLPCLMLSRYIQGRVAKQVEHLSNPQAPKKHESVQLTMNTPYVHPRFDVLGAEMPESLEVLLNKSIWDQADHQTATMGDISKGKNHK
ncbi:unnamed protein product [Vitrella brassicaformis CCMP3155]|uniref:Ion transport domain-containing protein n=1 Tax=Vitrella brassicaformis (strain CCMP3155) TaxID=1169540 RepID=A0A0G4FX28_VITBC|nr:unnamed protein product [Vitrella brassicaformis CCMP3155]|eukprot:CEM19511.1 unnamed protein product [Vitrella brassicaformis CCMP3155]